MRSAISKAAVFMHTFGCKVNQYEAQALKEKYARAGCRFTEKIEDADVLLIQSCTVTGEADRQCRQLIRRSLRKNPSLRVYVSGCYAARSPRDIETLSPSARVLDPQETASALQRGISSFDKHSRAFLKIQDGCDAYCSYCIVPYVRSSMTSRPDEEVIEEIARLAAKGYPEIVLTGVRLGKYEGGLERLLKKILGIGGGFRIRLSSLEPGEVSRELLALMKDNPERICGHLHLPLQSGSDRVLKKMRRPYTSGKFAEIIELIKKELPDAGVSTDIIVGFPGESDSDFKKTFALAKKLQLSRLHVFRYSEREGTLAAGFKESVPLEKIKARSAALRKLDAELQTHFWNRFLGRRLSAVLEGGKNTLLTDNYIRVGTDTKTDLIYNKIMQIKITDRQGRPWSIPA